MYKFVIAAVHVSKDLNRVRIDELTVFHLVLDYLAEASAAVVAVGFGVADKVFAVAAELFNWFFL
jgi:hypothetical protein